MGLNQIPDPYLREESQERLKNRSANYYVYEIIASGHYENIRKFIQYLSSLLYAPILVLPYRNPIQLSVYKERPWIYHDIELIDLNQIKADEILDTTDIHFTYSLETYRIYIESYWPLRDEAFRWLKGWVNFNIKSSMVQRHGYSYDEHTYCKDNKLVDLPASVSLTPTKTTGMFSYPLSNLEDRLETTIDCINFQTYEIADAMSYTIDSGFWKSPDTIDPILRTDPSTGVNLTLYNIDLVKFFKEQGFLLGSLIGQSDPKVAEEIRNYYDGIYKYWTIIDEVADRGSIFADDYIRFSFTNFYDPISHYHINWSSIWKFFIPETVWSAEYPTGTRIKELKNIADSKMETPLPRRPSDATNLIFVHSVKLRDIVVDINYKEKGEIIQSTGFYTCYDTWFYDPYRYHFPNYYEWYYRHEKGVAEILYEEYCNNVLGVLKDRPESRVCKCCYDFCGWTHLPYDVEFCYFQLNFLRVPAYHKKIPIWCFLYPIRIPPNWKVFIFSKEYLRTRDEVMRFMYVYDYNYRQYIRQFYFSYCSAVSKSLNRRS